MRKQQLNRALGFYAFAICLDAVITMIFGNTSLEYNKAVIYLANLLGFNFAVILWSIICFTAFAVISLLMYRFDLATTSFTLLVVLAIFHLQGALSWIFELHEWFRIPAIITVILFSILDLLEKFNLKNENKVVKSELA